MGFFFPVSMKSSGAKLASWVLFFFCKIYFDREIIESQFQTFLLIFNLEGICVPSQAANELYKGTTP